MQYQHINLLEAKAISRDQLKKWGHAGTVLRKDLIEHLKDIQLQLIRSSSPYKSVNFAIKKISTFLSCDGVIGELVVFNNRHIAYKLAYPEESDRGLQLFLIYGEINSRSKVCSFNCKVPLEISTHALDRLISRLATETENTLLEELYSCSLLAISWQKAAESVKATCWPLISKRGFFICSSVPNSTATNLITWIKSKNLSRKWSEVIRNLEQIKQNNPRLLEQTEFLSQFIISFPWMLMEHVPGADIEAQAWNSKGDEWKAGTQLANERLSTKAAATSQFVHRKVSATYISGLNYRPDVPSFKKHQIFDGMVTQVKDDGSLVVGLNNSWVGTLSKSTIDKSKLLMPDLSAPSIGDEVKVSIKVIKYVKNEEAYLIVLDLVKVQEIYWESVKKSISIGTEVVGEVVSEFRDMLGVRLANGVSGLIKKNILLMSLTETESFSDAIVGRKFLFSVAGYDELGQQLVLGITTKRPSIQIQSKLNNGLNGLCFYVAHDYSLIKLESGLIGTLHLNNMMGKELPAVNDKVIVDVIDIDYQKIDINLSIHCPDLQTRFLSLPHTDNRWNDFLNMNQVGSNVEVQVMRWVQGKYKFIVCEESGICGVIKMNDFIDHRLDSSTPPEVFIGSKVSAKIIKIEFEERKVWFSRRQAKAEMSIEKLKSKNIMGAYDGIVTSVKDYGCFIWIPSLEVEGLLHITAFPVGCVFSKGDSVRVRIEKIVEARISLSLICSSSNLI
jgi:ribosomal protein S1